MPVIVGSGAGPTDFVEKLQSRHVVFGDQILTGRTADGACWYVTKLTGWLDTPAVRLASSDKVQAHGAYLGQSFFSARQITVEGTITAPRDALLVAIRQLGLAVSDPSTPADLVIADANPAAGVASVLLGGQLLTKPVGAGGFAYSLPLTAPDPRIYSEVVKQADLSLSDDTDGLEFPFGFPFSFGNIPNGNAVTATNSGNISTSPTVRFYGPLSSPTIVNNRSGRSVRIPLTIIPGDYIDVDMGAKTILLNGYAPRPASLSGRFWDLQPGQTEITFGASSGSGTARLFWRDAWIN